MKKSQIDEISDLLLSYSAGDYHVKGDISENFDEIDMIISGINMLGEELLSTNVSKEYFSSIFNTVTDLVMVVNENGHLLDFNKAVYEHLGYDENEMNEKTFSLLLENENVGLFSKIKNVLTPENNHYVVESKLKTNKGKIIYGLFTCSMIFDRFDKFNGYLISIKDITAQKEQEKLILKTIISTQSAEQRRVADDLHDSLGQELSMAQLMISNFSRFKIDDEEYYNLMELCNEIMENAIKRLREICFDLMPNVLVKGGLELAIQTLIGKLRRLDKIQVDFVSTKNFPRLNSELEIVVYRIIQEFINNMIKHSSASQLNVKLIEAESTIEVTLEENGQGFDLAKLNNIGENRGLSNIRTKVHAYNGQYDINSSLGVGTELWVEFPKIEQNG